MRGLCSELPKVLDVAPDVKTSKTEFDSPHHLWRDTRFAVVFETTVETAFGPDSFSYVTEKALKPLRELEDGYSKITVAHYDWQQVKDSRRRRGSKMSKKVKFSG